MTIKELIELIKSDIKRRMVTENINFSIFGILKTLFMPSSVVVILYRLEKYFFEKNLYIFVKICALLNIVLFSTEIPPRCEIGKGFLIGHANGILIHDNVKIGKNCTLMHQCYIGIRERSGISKENLRVIIGDGVLIGAGARILGPLEIGNECQIGMNAVLTSSIPDNSVVVGIPARIIKKVAPDTSAPKSNFHRPELQIQKNKKKITLKKTLKLFKEDLKNRARLDGKPFGWQSYFKCWFNPTVLAVLIYRFQHLAYHNNLGLIAKALNILNVIFFKVEIGSKAKIDGGLVLGHCNGIIINNNTIIGKNCVFYQHNTVAIGPRSGMNPLSDRVIMGNNVIVGAGARIIGNISVGDNCIIGMNAVVTKNIPDFSVVAGVPIKVIKRCSEKVFPKSENQKKDLNEATKFKDRKKHVTFRQTIQLIKEDISFRYSIEKKKVNKLTYIKIFFNPPALATIIFRFQHFFWSKELAPMAKLLAIFNIIFFSVDIGSAAEIDGGLVLAHAVGILIHNQVKIGKRCIFTAHNTVTVGPCLNLAQEYSKVVLGNDVFVGIGARIVGNLKIGDGTKIGVNAVVTKSFPSQSTLIGIPARQLHKL